MIRAVRTALGAFSQSEAPLHRIFRNTGWLLASKFLGAALSLIYLALLTRSLGPKNFGEFMLISALGQAIASVVAFQSWRIVLRFGTAAHLADDKQRVDRLIWFSILLDLAAALLGCAIAVLMVWLLADDFHWSTATARHAVYFAFVLLLTIRSTAVGVLRLHDRFRDGATADAAAPIMRMLGAAVVMLAGPSITGFLLAWAAAELATTAAYWAFVFKRIRPRLPPQTLRKILSVPSEHDGFWRFAIFCNINATLASASQQVALLAVGYVAGAAEAGFFRLAHQLGQALLTLAEMLSRALYAEMARVQESSSRDAMRNLLKRANTTACIAGAMVVLLVVIAGKPALYLIGGAPYLPAYPMLVLLGSAAAVQLVGVSFEPALLALNRTGRLLLIRVASLLCLAAMLAWMLPTFGAVGAAVAMLVSTIAGISLLGLAARRLTLKSQPAGLTPPQ